MEIKVDLGELSLEVGVRIVKLMNVLELDPQNRKNQKLAQELTEKLLLHAIRKLNSGQAKNIEEALA